MNAPETDRQRSELAAAQAKALDDSGWGVRFHLVQPRNPGFWVLIIGLVAGLATMAPIVMDSSAVYGTAMVVGIIAFGVYAIPWWMFLHYHDRYTPLPDGFLTVGFVWGAIASTFWMAYNVNAAVLALYAKLFGHEWALSWGAGFTAPITEEVAKATGLILLITLGSRLVRSPYDGFVIGAFIGLGFQIAEDMLYAAQSAIHSFGSDQVGQALHMVVVRGLSGIVSHALYSAIFCAGLVWFIGRPAVRRNRPLGAALMLLAMAIHFTWDVSAALAGLLFGDGRYLFVVLGFSIVVAVSAVVLVARRASDVERHWMRDLLAPEVLRGTIGEEEVDALAGSRNDHRRYVHAHKGRRRAARNVLHATSELASSIALHHGNESDETTHLRDEVIRLRVAST